MNIQTIATLLTIALCGGCMAPADESEHVVEDAQAFGIGLCKVFCDDGEPCTVDACAPTGGCVHTLMPSGSFCQDDERQCRGTCFASYTDGNGVTWPGECDCTEDL